MLKKNINKKNYCLSEKYIKVCLRFIMRTYSIKNIDKQKFCRLKNNSYFKEFWALLL